MKLSLQIPPHLKRVATLHDDDDDDDDHILNASPH